MTRVLGDPAGETAEVTIEEIGARGDGIARRNGAPVFVPFSAPGDRLKLRLGAAREKGRAAEIAEILIPGPDRAAPACPHFGVCGGCALQHLTDSAYAGWKRDLVRTTLSHRGFENVSLGDLVRTPPHSRRRANFKAMRGPAGIVLGFYERGSHRVVDVARCPVLRPEIESLIAPLRGLMAALLDPGAKAEVDATLAATGIDLTIATSTPPDRGVLERIAAFAEKSDLARVNWLVRGSGSPRTIVSRRPVFLEFAGVRVDLPPRAFLQPSAAGEDALVGRVVAACAGAKNIADLYSGCGTFTFPLARGARVHAAEADEAMAAALISAARRANLAASVTAEARDLERRPLLASDLDPYDAVVFDPPRPGAKRQATEIARSAVPVAVAVSCNPASFARDARLLVDGGYALQSVTPLDQFLWSPHVEIIAVFRK